MPNRPPQTPQRRDAPLLGGVGRGRSRCGLGRYRRTNSGWNRGRLGRHGRSDDRRVFRDGRLRRCPPTKLDSLTDLDGIGRRDAIARGQGFPVPAEAEGNGIQGVAAAHDVPPAGDRRTRSGRRGTVAIDDLDPPGGDDEQAARRNRRRPRATGGSHRRAESIAAGSLLASILPLIHLLRFRSIGPATPAAGSGDRAVEQRDETYRVEYLAAEPVLGADDQHQLLDLAATDRDHQTAPGANWSSNDCGTSVAAAVTMIPL